VEVLAKVLQARVVQRALEVYLEVVILVATQVPQEIRFSSYHSLAVGVATVTEEVYLF
jgi:hypothetical protein